MRFLEMIETVLLAVPWAFVAFLVVIGAIYALAIGSWVALVVWVDVLGQDVPWNLEPAGAWDPDDAEEATNGHAT